MVMYFFDPNGPFADLGGGGASGGSMSARARSALRPEIVGDTISASCEAVLVEKLDVLNTPYDEKQLKLACAQMAGVLSGRAAVLTFDDGIAPAVIDVFMQQVVRIMETLSATRQEAAIAKIADVVLPDPLADVRGILAIDNLKLRERFVASEPLLSSAAVGTQAGHESANPYATAARWKKAGKIFSINHGGEEKYPAFQFRDGQPHPTVARVLDVLPKSMTPWQVAFWFVSTNGWLDDAAPKDRLDQAEDVVAAARHENEEVMG